MGIGLNRVQWICSPLVGWALLSGAVSPSWGQTTPATPDNTTGAPVPGTAGAIPGAGGTAPTGTVPGTIVAPTTTTQDNTTTPGGAPQPTPSSQPAPTAGAAARPLDSTASTLTSGFAGTPDRLTSFSNQLSDTGNLIYGAPVATSLSAFGIGAGGGGGSAGGDELGISWGAFTLYPAIDIGTGVDNIDLHAAGMRGITVCNTPGITGFPGKCPRK